MTELSTTIMFKIPMPIKITPTTQQVDWTLQSVVAAAQSLIALDLKHFANLWAFFLELYTHPTFQLILSIPIQVSFSTPPSFNQFQDEYYAIKNSIQALTKLVADLQPKVKEAKASAAKTPPSTGNPSAQGKGPSSTQTSMYASKATSRPQPSLILDLGAINPDNHLPHQLQRDNHIHSLYRVVSVSSSCCHCS